MDIEGLSIAAVLERIAWCDCLAPYLNYKDKEPSWDGNIYVFEDKRKTKVGIRRIPAQVKGSTNLMKGVETIHYNDAEVSDLENYFSNQGGVIYFVVAIHKDDNRIKPRQA